MKLDFELVWDGANKSSHKTLPVLLTLLVPTTASWQLVWMPDPSLYCTAAGLDKAFAETATTSLPTIRTRPLRVFGIARPVSTGDYHPGFHP